MRKILLATIAAIAVISATGLLTGRANALTLTSPSSMREAVDSTNLTDNVRWVCRYDWRGYRRCWWQPHRHRYWRHRYY